MQDTVTAISAYINGPNWNQKTKIFPEVEIVMFESFGPEFCVVLYGKANAAHRLGC